MAKTIPTNIATEIQNESIHPYELYTIFLDNDTLYFTNHDQTISFFNTSDEATDFLPIYIKRGDIQFDRSALISHCTVSLDNVNRAMGAYIAQNEFRARRMLIQMVFEGHTTLSTDVVALFDGLMDKPQVSETQMQVEVISRGGTLAKQTPGRMYSIMCPWKFASSECNFDDEATQVTEQRIDIPGSTTVRIYDITRSETQDYWKHGTFILTSGLSSGQKRKIVSSSGNYVYLDYALASGVEVDDWYTLQQGCDKSITQCSGLSNSANYGGFPTIPQAMVIR